MDFFVLCVGLPRAVVPLLVIANFLAVYRVVSASKDGVTVSTYALLESVVALLIEVRILQICLQMCMLCRIKGRVLRV